MGGKFVHSALCGLSRSRRNNLLNRKIEVVECRLASGVGACPDFFASFESGLKIFA